jgi:hypothetical protein
MSFKTFIYGHPKELILKEIEMFGKKLSELAKEDNYKPTEKNKAKHYKQNLEATRKAYMEIKEGSNPREILKGLFLYTKDSEVNKILEKTGRYAK